MTQPAHCLRLRCLGGSDGSAASFFFRVLRKRNLRRKANTTAEPFRDRAVKCAGALNAHASFEFYDERTMRCFPWRASKWEDDAAGSLSAPEVFGRERRQRRGFFLPCTAEERFARRADTTAESFHDRAVKCAGALTCTPLSNFTMNEPCAVFHGAPQSGKMTQAARCLRLRCSGGSDGSAASFFFRVLRKRNLRRKANTTAESFRDRAVKCTSALDAHVSFEFYGERTMRCFPWRASKWEDDAGGSLSAPEAFGRERRQCRGFFFRVLRKKFAAVFSFFGMEITLFA